jgi:hypothetical protein
MDIQSLRLVATENELNGLMLKFIPEMKTIRDLRLKLLRSGISITGTYQSIIGIPFEIRWEPFIHKGKIAARLKSLKTAGLNLGLFEGYLMGAIASATNIVTVEGDMLLFDVDVFLEKMEVPLRTNLTNVRCTDGRLIIESDTVAA